MDQGSESKMANQVEKESDLQAAYPPITPTTLLTSLDEFLSLVSKINDRRNFSFGNRSGISERNGNQEENQLAVQTALFLLHNLPPARSAALAYLAQSLSKQVWQFMQRNDAPPVNKENTLEYQIETLLSELVESSPEVWGPLVARWAVDQLGRWSVEWEGIILGRGDTTLEERVASWLGCSPAHTLANLTVSCVALDADNTVAALLETSLHSGPALDWLVAHVGCSFPATIVNRVLSLGLRSFASSATQNQASQQLVSVNTILNHLAERHFPDIQRGLQHVLLTTFSNSPDACAKAAVPYLLQLATNKRSRFILNALTATLSKVILHGQNLSALANQLSWWIPKYFSSTSQLIELLVHLLLDTDGMESSELIGFLLQASVSSEDSAGISITRQLIDHLLSELCTLTYMKKIKPPLRPNIPLINGLGLHIKENLMHSGVSNDDPERTIVGLTKWAVMSEKEYVVKRLGQILTFLALQQGPEVATCILKQIFSSKLPLNHETLYLIHSLACALVSQQSFYNRPFTALTRTLSANLHMNLKPMEILLTVEKVRSVMIGTRTHKSFVHEAFNNAILSNIPKLARLINAPEIGSSVLELIGQFSLDKPMCLSHVFTLGHAVIFYFYNCLRDDNKERKLSNSNMCNKILAQLCQSSVGHSFLVRLLFEAAFRSEWAYCLGSTKEVHFEFKESNDNLLRTNLQFDSWVKLPQSHNTIFHAGKIGQQSYSARFKKPVSLRPDVIALNTQLVLNALAICCRAQGPSQGSTTIALLLVEYVSPDIMFNGFPWPEENIKFTFERDLVIKKTFYDFPIAWHFLELVARNRPALCYCSVLVRALTAAYTAFWNTFSGNIASLNTRMLTATERLLEIIVVGQFLPAAFSVLPQMVNHLAPHEIVCVLQDVWAYLRNHTPSPDRWVLLPCGVHDRPPEPPDPRYTDRCRKLIMIHIETLGHLLPSMMNHRPEYLKA